MSINYVNSVKANKDTKFEYVLNQEHKGPFDLQKNELKNFIQSVNDFSISYKLKTFIPHKNINYLQCYKWNIIQNYSFDKRAHFILSLQIIRSYCSSNVLENFNHVDLFISKLYWIHIAVVILASISFVLSWKYIYRIAKMYWKIKTKLKSSYVCNNNTNNNKKIKSDNTINDSNINKPKTKWDMLKTNEKRRLFNKWSIICIIGNIIQIFGTILSLVDYEEVDTSSEVLIGFGCMLAFINIGRYLDYNKDYSTIYATISRALPNVIRYLLGVMPIFFGFIFSGICIFWRSENFSNTSSTMITLFAVMNGDSVFDVFNDVSGVSFFLGQLYCYSFCIVFIV